MTQYPSSWSDMSDFVVHFTRGGENADDYRSFLGICGIHSLKPANAFGIGRKLCPNVDSQKAVCFSEIPPGEWSRLEDRRETKYGIGFRKSWVTSKGGGPIWYVWKESPPWHVLTDMMKNASSDPSASIWKLTPLIDAPGEYDGAPYFFDWEREWRHVGEFSFDPADVSFLLIPESHHGHARGFFEEAQRENTGPAYFCPYVDPSWERGRILETLSGPRVDSQHPEIRTPNS